MDAQFGADFFDLSSDSACGCGANLCGGFVFGDKFFGEAAVWMSLRSDFIAF